MARRAFRVSIGFFSLYLQRAVSYIKQADINVALLSVHCNNTSAQAVFNDLHLIQGINNSS